jgi:short-subunit dehydrogenase
LFCYQNYKVFFVFGFLSFQVSKNATFDLPKLHMKQVVFITGASSGIGEAIATRLADKGYVVYGASRHRKDNQKFNFHFLQLDIREQDSINRSINYVIEKEGRIDILINNAGLGMIGALEDTTIEESKSIFETNVFGLHAMCNSVIPHMRKQKSGLIINISSIAGKIGLPYRGIYNATKHAIEGFSEALSMELRPFNIKVIIMEPGDFRTSINTNRKIAKKALEPSSPYFNSFHRTLDQVFEEVNSAWSTDKIAKDVERIINYKYPRLRFISAPLKQKLSIIMHKVLPARLFESIISYFYKV